MELPWGMLLPLLLVLSVSSPSSSSAAATLAVTAPPPLPVPPPRHAQDAEGMLINGNFETAPRRLNKTLIVGRHSPGKAGSRRRRSGSWPAASAPASPSTAPTTTPRSPTASRSAAPCWTRSRLCLSRRSEMNRESAE
ncbi:hypothetical protein ZEAMMB73_Zm00001d034547 [Zea mays]|uniref:Uncharacterized protein n=1 Tax=Zea mays TaxID=4577 RepID=A0A1D6L8I6_MAIZE|nr:hypothetical protein ZEAMMB73_Zm00001d034547 [Zea mays]